MIYLSIPYTGTEYLSFRVSCAIAAELMKQGYVVFSPITHSHPIAEYGGIEKGDHEFWLRQDLAMLERCQEMIVIRLPGWDTSRGVEVEMTEALEAEIPVRSIDPFDYISTKQLIQWGMGEMQEVEA